MIEMIKIDLPENVNLILEMLNDVGYAAYIVGGCVRDSLMGIEPHDWDITTSAKPDEIRKVFENIKFSKNSFEISFKVIPTGEKYGTMTVEVIHSNATKCFSKYTYEVTTFRYDSNYSDGRRPDSVQFGESIIDDLARRDFTINAIAYNPIVGYIDPFNGALDIQNKIIKAIDPQKRMQEDALRVLRGIRFACKYNFTLENCTGNAIAGCGGLLKNVSKERIQEEILKILTYSNGNSITLNSCIDVLATIFEITENQQKEDDLALSKWGSNKLIDIIDNNNPISIKLFNMLKLYKPKFAAEIWLRKYKFSNNMVKAIMNYYGIEEYVEATFYYYMETRKFDVLVKTLYNKFEYNNVVKYLDNDSDWASRLRIMIDKQLLDKCYKEPYQLSRLDLTGYDISGATNLFGKDIGKCKEYLLKKVIEDKSLNDNKILIVLAKEFANSLKENKNEE